MALTRIERRKRIRQRIRKIVNGHPEKPRLAVYRSNRQIYVQAIDDLNGKTLASASSREKEISGKGKISKKEQARQVGELIAKRLKEKGIENVTFDRGGYLYHGRVKELADAARKGGLNF
ncbi:MAG: 50S ribosomal protein L18 [Chlorobi bacterium]|nr:50S ribosomal protein L18 [Chlorobiota bacterium]